MQNRGMTLNPLGESTELELKWKPEKQNAICDRLKMLQRVLTECILNMSSLKCLQVYCWCQHVQVFKTYKNTLFHPDPNEF